MARWIGALGKTLRGDAASHPQYAALISSARKIVGNLESQVQTGNRWFGYRRVNIEGGYVLATVINNYPGSRPIVHAEIFTHRPVEEPEDEIPERVVQGYVPEFTELSDTEAFLRYTGGGFSLSVADPDVTELVSSVDPGSYRSLFPRIEEGDRLRAGVIDWKSGTGNIVLSWCDQRIATRYYGRVNGRSIYSKGGVLAIIPEGYSVAGAAVVSTDDGRKLAVIAYKAGELQYMERPFPRDNALGESQNLLDEWEVLYTETHPLELEGFSMPDVLLTGAVNFFSDGTKAVGMLSSRLLNFGPGSDSGVNTLFTTHVWNKWWGEVRFSRDSGFDITYRATKRIRALEAKTENNTGTPEGEPAMPVSNSCHTGRPREYTNPFSRTASFTSTFVALESAPPSFDAPSPSVIEEYVEYIPYAFDYSPEGEERLLSVVLESVPDILNERSGSGMRTHSSSGFKDVPDTCPDRFPSPGSNFVAREDWTESGSGSGSSSTFAAIRQPVLGLYLDDERLGTAYTHLNTTEIEFSGSASVSRSVTAVYDPANYPVVGGENLSWGGSGNASRVTTHTLEETLQHVLFADLRSNTLLLHLADFTEVEMNEESSNVSLSGSSTDIEDQITTHLETKQVTTEATLEWYVDGERVQVRQDSFGYSQSSPAQSNGFLGVGGGNMDVMLNHGAILVDVFVPGFSGDDIWDTNFWYDPFPRTGSASYVEAVYPASLDMDNVGVVAISRIRDIPTEVAPGPWYNPPEPVFLATLNGEDLSSIITAPPLQDTGVDGVGII